MNVKKNLNKKAQELPLQTIIIALIVIVVFVVMVVIFRGGVGKIFPWFEAATECSAQGGNCIEDNKVAECRGTGGTTIQAGCPEEKPWCCIKQKE